MDQYLLAIDQGTTSSRAVLFDLQGTPVFQHQIGFRQYFPQDGWVEHDPMEIWQTTWECCQQVIKNSQTTLAQILAVGITNQRETTIVWDRISGEPIYPAIVWQDRRTADVCKQLQQDESIASMVQTKTGLLLDPYFSATKISWILNQVPQARSRAERGELAFGTIDSWLIWQLSNGSRHVTDITNASRTLLFNIRDQQWDDDLLKLFSIPRSLLPEVLDNVDQFAEIKKSPLQGLHITGVAGDQQAAAIGQACISLGMAKSTYGTGCFILMNTGKNVIQSKHRLISTVAFRINHSINYALEGSIFIAGAVMQWLRDGLQIISSSEESEFIAKQVDDNGGVYFVPAFTGLGAPWWDPNARGSIFGLTRNSQRAHIVRAALESISYQTKDLIHAMLGDFHQPLKTLRVDGGMAKNNWLLQFIADMTGINVERPAHVEMTALGVAFLAGLGCGVYRSIDDVKNLFILDREFNPIMEKNKSDLFYQKWSQAVDRSKNWISS